MFADKGDIDANINSFKLIPKLFSMNFLRSSC